MALSDTLVIGPVPPFKQPLRVRLAVLLLVGGGALLAVSLAVLATTMADPAAIAATLPTFAANKPIPASARQTASILVSSQPAGAAVLADGQELGRTPAIVAAPVGSQLILRRNGYLDCIVVDPHGQASVALWRQPEIQAVRSPLPGGKIVGVDVLTDGRIVLDITVPTAPKERQAWVFDPVAARAARLGPAILEGAAPAGVAVAPDGVHTVSLLRGTAAAASTFPSTQLPPADSLIVDGPGGRHAFLPDGALVRGEQVLDLSWAPTGGAALLLSQRPVSGGSRFRLRRIDADGSFHDLVDLPIEPVESSWIWSPSGQSVAFLVRTAAPAMATLDIATGGVRSVADLPNDVVPGIGALAPASWTGDGSLLFAGPVADDAFSATPSPQPTRSVPATVSQQKPPPFFAVYELGSDRATSRRLGTTTMLAAAPAVLADGTLVELARDAHDGTMLLRTLDPQGNPLTEQRLGVRVPARLSVRWDLAHGHAIVLLPAEAGGIDVHVLAFGQEASQ